MELGTIVVALIALFLMYRTGLVGTAQKSLETVNNTLDKANRVAERRLDYWDASDEESITKQYGKLLTKINDKETDRASKKMVKKAFKSLDIDEDA